MAYCGIQFLPIRCRRFKKCKEAIDAGLEKFQSKDYAAAIELFSLALELPGNGAYRLPGSPREYSCPSDAEEAAALYNMACCYAQMRQADAALTCIEAILEVRATPCARSPHLRPSHAPRASCSAAPGMDAHPRRQ